MSLIQLHDLTFQPFISSQQLQQRVLELGDELSEQFAGQHPVVIVVLNGAFIFAADLVRVCRFDVQIVFVRLASYDGIHSSGTVRKLIDFQTELAGRPVIIIEDIVDSGRTMKELIKDVEQFQPASISLVTLLLKPLSLTEPISPDYVGFEIADDFVVGYGMDYNGLGRNLPGIFKTGS